MEYKITFSESGFKGLEEQVNKLMNQGQKPLGGIAFKAGYPYQAIARVVEIKEKTTESKPKTQEEKHLSKKLCRLVMLCG